MLNPNDKLMCVKGNELYIEGRFYTVGEFINDQYFELLTGHNDELWYARIDNQGICVPFEATKYGYSDAWFIEIEDENNAT